MERETAARGGKVKVNVGCRVTVQDVDSDEPLTITVVPSEATDPYSGNISPGSPLAAALMGHAAGETVQVEAHEGVRTFRILRVVQVLTHS